MIVDCSDCLVRDIACGDCVVTVLLGTPGWQSNVSFVSPGKHPRISLEQEELGAMDILADSGLVPRLKLVLTDGDGPEDGSRHRSRRDEDSGDQRAG